MFVCDFCFSKIERWITGLINGGMDGWMDGMMEVWIDGWMMF